MNTGECTAQAVPCALFSWALDEVSMSTDAQFAVAAVDLVVRLCVPTDAHFHSPEARDYFVQARQFLALEKIAHTEQVSLIQRSPNVCRKFTE